MTSVVAVIAAYEPGDDLVGNVKLIVDQVESVIVVDDGSPSRLAEPHGRVAGLFDACRALGAEIVESSDNFGIAHALNCGVRLALQRGADAVLTLDQDSQLCDDYVRRVISHLDLAASVGVQLAIASPSVINGLLAPFWFAVDGMTMSFEPIQSGMVVTREVFDAIGLFDESLFIDCVDTEFYLRLRSRGGCALVVPGARMRHRLGMPTRWVPPRPVRWLLRGRLAEGFEFGEDAPLRHYYVARNRLRLYRRYGLREPLWCAVSIAKDGIARSRSIAFASSRRARLYLSCAGVRAALRGDTGRIPERTLRRAQRLG